jgi:hypothetical protein
MLKPFSIFGLGFLFYMISPKLREDVHTALGAGVGAMDRNAPYSYIAGGVVVIISVVIAFNRGSRAR